MTVWVTGGMCQQHNAVFAVFALGDAGVACLGGQGCTVPPVTAWTWAPWAWQAWVCLMSA